MAQPIVLTSLTRDPKQELLMRLEQATADHAAALLDSYELLQKMHDHGVFTTIRGVLTAGDKLVETVAEGANTPQAIRAMRNMILLGQMLGSIDSKLVEATHVAVSRTFGDARKLAYEPPSLLGFIRGFLNQDLRRAMALITTFLRNFADQLKIQTRTDS